MVAVNYGTPFLTESEPHNFTICASDLGLKPGEWPSRFETNIGNKQDFVHYTSKTSEGDLQYMKYRQCLGCVTLVIYND